MEITFSVEVRLSSNNYEQISDYIEKYALAHGNTIYESCVEDDLVKVYGLGSIDEDFIEIPTDLIAEYPNSEFCIQINHTYSISEFPDYTYYVYRNGYLTMETIQECDQNDELDETDCDEIDEDEATLVFDVYKDSELIKHEFMTIPDVYGEEYAEALFTHRDCLDISEVAEVYGTYEDQMSAIEDWLDMCRAYR